MAPAAGGMPPMDPAAMAGGMPMDPMAMAGGMPPGGAPMDPMAMAGGAPGMPMDPAAGGGVAGQKMKPEQYMQMLDFRLYNLQQQITTLMNSMDIKMDPGVLVTPPGAPMGPPPEAAMQGGPQDPANSAQPQGGGGGSGSAISAIDPMQGASPELAMGGAGGGGMPGGEKMGEALSFSDFIEHMAGDGIGQGRQLLPKGAGSKKANAVAPVGVPYTIAVMPDQAPKDNVAAAAAMMRSRTLAAAR
jgi:hypothetical protein